jgi:hypothetical protein
MYNCNATLLTDMQLYVRACVDRSVDCSTPTAAAAAPVPAATGFAFGAPAPAPGIYTTYSLLFILLLLRLPQ